MNNNSNGLTGMKILIVDDVPQNIDVLRKILGDNGFVISVVPSGEMALKLINKDQPDLILLDVMMPGLNGFETCQSLKADKKTAHIPVIFVTARTEVDDVVEGFKVGGADYILKPFREEEVLARIRTQLQLQIKTQKLIEAQEELKRSNRDLQAFASVVSHDLKAPLRNIHNLADFLIEDQAALLNEKGKNDIYKLKEMVVRMSKLIDGILQFSQITLDPKPFESINLKELIQRVIDNLQVSIKETKGVIHTGDLPIIKGDPILLMQLFQNLIANALKFHRNNEPPIINIDSQFDGNNLWKITIEDNGIGFDEKEAENIFLPLKRLVSSSQYEGSGIGLATCKKIASRHKGTITCKSQKEKGATFIVNLPKFSEI